jgi:hypothetical protein
LLSYDEKTVLDIIEKVTKSVVNISTIKLVHSFRTPFQKGKRT